MQLWQGFCSEVHVSRSYAVVARVLFKLILYDAVVERFKIQRRSKTDTVHAGERRLRRKCALTIYRCLQQVTFVCSRESVHATPYDNTSTAAASAGAVPTTPAGNGDGAVLGAAIPSIFFGQQLSLFPTISSFCQTPSPLSTKKNIFNCNT